MSETYEEPDYIITTGTTVIFNDLPEVYLPTLQPPIISSRIDDNGSTQFVYGNFSEEPIGTEPVLEEKLDLPASPSIIFEQCTGTTGFVVRTSEQTIGGFKVTWDPSSINNITGYQVFWSENNVSTVLGKEIGIENPRSYAGGPLFAGQSGVLSRDVYEFSYKYPNTLDYVIRKLNVFIFAYNDVGRSIFPEYMVSYILYDKSGALLRKIYKELTTASYPKEVDVPTYNILDDSTGKFGSTQNILESDIL